MKVHSSGACVHVCVLHTRNRLGCWALLRLYVMLLQLHTRVATRKWQTDLVSHKISVYADILRKILRGQFTPISGPYTASFVQLASSLMTRKPEQRPDTNTLLRNPTLIAKVRAACSGFAKAAVCDCSASWVIQLQKACLASHVNVQQWQRMRHQHQHAIAEERVEYPQGCFPAGWLPMLLLSLCNSVQPGTSNKRLCSINVDSDIQCYTHAQ
jgi:hypothetical protein